MLSSSTIWASSISLLDLASVDERWREEVVKRMGTSLFSLYGPRVCFGTPETELLLSLMESSWSRFRRIYVETSDKKVMADPRWHSVYQPAAHLEFFEVRFRLDAPVFSKENGLLFGDYSPKLHTFEMFNLKVKLGSSWGKNLRRLSLIHCTVDHSIFVALPQMNILESLAVENVKFSSIPIANSPSENIHLPKLDNLEISVEFTTMVVLLDRIKPTPGCSADIKGMSCTPRKLRLASSFCLSQNLANYVKCSNRRNLGLRISPWIFDVNTDDDAYDKEDSNKLPAEDQSSYLSISIEFSGERMPYPVVDILDFCDFSSLEVLRLEIENTDIQISDSRLMNFSFTLDSIKVVEADSQTLEVIHDIQDCTSLLLFPSLQKVILDAEEDSEIETPAILQFLLQRNEMNAPFLTFQHAQYTSPVDKAKLEFLEGLDFIEVVVEGGDHIAAHKSIFRFLNTSNFSILPRR